MSVEPVFPLYRAALCGLLAMLVGVGIARFGYAPLVPALVAGHWFSASQAFWLGTVNLVGYLIGAALMRSWRRPVQTRPAVTGLMGITCLCLLASAWNGGVVYAGVWRLLSGITGGILMVLMAAAVVGRAPAAQRGQVGGITFAGMGSGITICGLLIPHLVKLGLPATWALLGLFAALATLAVWLMMPPATIQPAPRAARRGRVNRPVAVLVAGYSLCAFGFVPHMLFLSSFVAIGLQKGVAAGADVSAVLGIAAALGPPLLGRLADRFGFLKTLYLGYFVMAAAVAVPVLSGRMLGLEISAFGVGAIGLGAVLLTSGAIATLVAPGELAASWGLATMAYAVLQAGSAAAFSSLFHASGSYRLLFGIGAGACFVSAVFVLAAARLAVRVDADHGG